MYVIAQVRISAVISIGKYVADIQELLRRIDLPRFKRGIVQTLVLPPPQSSAVEPKIMNAERFDFLNKDGTWAVVLGPDSISLHTSEYTEYGFFELKLRQALEIIHQVVGITLSERLGLRYIDLIRAGVGESLRDYVRPEIQGLDPAKVGASTSLARFEFVGKTEYGQLVAKMYETEDGTFLPPELRPTNLVHSVALKPAETVLMLDLDHFSEEVAPFDVDGVLNGLGELHDNLDRAFRAAVTEGALKRWSEKD